MFKAEGMSGGIDAANKGHGASCPNSHAYFDYDLNAIDLKKVYQFDPILKKLWRRKKFIIGGECQHVVEHVHNEKELDSKVFPRILAMCEVLWSTHQIETMNIFIKNYRCTIPF